MRIYYGGAEAPTLRRRLASSGAVRFSVSYWHLRDRLPQDGTFPFAERFPKGAEILLDSGGYTANKRREEHDGQYWVEYLDAYLELLAVNIEALSFVTEFDFLDYSVDDLWALRYDVWAKLPEEKFLPVWHTEHGFDELHALAQTYSQVAIPGDDLKEIAHRIPAIANRYGTRIHGLSVSSESLITTAGLHSVSSTSWTGPQRHGDRVVWDGGQLRRYPKKYADTVVEKHRAFLERNDFDLEAIEVGDPEELTRLTIWSFEAWADHLSRGGILDADQDGVSPSRVEESGSNAEVEYEEVGQSSSEGGTSALERTGERKILPVFGLQQRKVINEHGEEVRGAPEMHTRVTSARQCDTCYVKQICPEAKAGASCAFDIPVEVKTKDQLSAMLTGMIEIQTQRALFARFAEELEGGYPAEKVSAEFDRLMKMTHTVKEIQDNRDFMEIHVRSRGNAGVLTRLFGEQAGQQSRELDRPLDPEETNEVLADIIDVEVE